MAETDGREIGRGSGRGIRKRWFLGAATLALLIFIVFRKSEVARLGIALRGADWRWMPIAIFFEAMFQCNEATIYWMTYRTLGRRTNLTSVMHLTLAASFVNRVAPSAGISGTAFFAERMAHRGVPASDTVSVNIARYILDYGAFGIILGIGMLYLASHRELSQLEVRAAIIFGALLLIVLCVALVVMQRKQVLVGLVGWTAGVINRAARRIRGNAPISAENVRDAASGILSGIDIFRRGGTRSITLVVMGFMIHLFDLGSLAAIFLAVGYHVHPGILIAGYGLGYLAGFISMVPSGVGVFEASMTLVYSTLGVPVGTAALVTILYRTTSLWLPLLAGYVALHIALQRKEQNAS